MSVQTRRILAVLFILALVAGFVVALLPTPHAVDLGDGRDKWAHFLAFFAFALFGFTVWPARIPSVFVGLLIYGLAMELAQSVTAHRMGDPLDWLADAAGALSAWLVWVLWQRLRPTAV
jgi:VanZ family protein